MEQMHTEDGQLFIKSLASFIRQHEKALANSLQVSVLRTQAPNNPSSTSLPSLASTSNSALHPSSSSSIAAAFSFAGLNFMSHSIKPAHLTLTPHHLFYLLSRLEELDIPIGPMNVRLENIHNESSPANYVSFLHQTQNLASGRSDKDSIHSVSSVRSVMSGVTALWSNIGLGYSNASASDKAKAALEADLKYLYSAFTKLPALRLSPDHRARLIKGYEEFPFDTAVPLFAFKNVQQLDIIDIDFRHFFGWDRLADQLTLLTVKRANLDDPTDLLTNIVLDDADRRRRRSAKGDKYSTTSAWVMPSHNRVDLCRSHSDPGSPTDLTSQPMATREDDQGDPKSVVTPRVDKSPKLASCSISPNRPTNSRPTTSYRHVRTHSTKAKRSGSGSSGSSEYSLAPHRSESSSNLPITRVLSPSKWQRLKYLSLADNSLTSLSVESFQPLANSLRSLNLSSNLFTEVPDCLASLTRLSSLDMSNCMIESLHSLERNPLPAILTLQLKSNRLQSLAGIQRLLSLEVLNVQANMLSDPMEAARLTGIPNLRRIWVKHNPFTKRIADHRVTIFNLFRSTPGYTDDIIIDESGPGYGERKLLVDRVPEVERPRQRREQNPTVVVQQPTRLSPETDAMIHQHVESRPHLHNAESEFVASSTRRKRAPRRRMVELTHDEALASIPDLRLNRRQDEVPGSLTQTRSAAIEDAPAGIERSSLRRDSGVTPDDLSLEQEHDFPQQAIHAQQYRHKVEVLKREFGKNWIGALSEQGWDSARGDLPRSNIHIPPQRANSQVAVNGARTLG